MCAELFKYINGTDNLKVNVRQLPPIDFHLVQFICMS